MFDDTAPELAEDLPLRWARAQARLREADADALLVASNVNLFYLSGRIFSGFVYLPVEGEPRFLTRRPATATGRQTLTLRKPEELPDLLRATGLALPTHILLEDDDLSYHERLRLAALFPNARSADGSALLRRCRAVKTPHEIRIMKKTGSRHAQTIARFASVFEPGMTDHAWTLELARLMLDAGSLGLFRVSGRAMEAFMGSVLAGDNAAAASPYDFALGGAGLHPSLPVGACGATLEPGMAVMADIAANFYGYLTDCSRTFAVGAIAAKAHDAHQVALDIQRAVAEAGRPGASCEALYNLARNQAERSGLADRFMGLTQQARFIGHGTGLVINELPVIGARSRDLIEEGMCIALEPKFVIPGTGAVGVEDTFLATRSGMVNLTPCDPAILPL